MLYPGSAKPLYEQLKDIILEKIKSGELKMGSSMLGERNLAEMYGVSRATVRQTIGELVNDGVLFRQHGKGTFVANQKIERPLARLLGVAEELSLEDVNVDITLISSGFVEVSGEIVKNLGLNTGEKAYLNCRLITANHQPLFVDYSYMPQTVGYIIDKCDMKRDIFYNILESYGYKIRNAEQRISSDSASIEDANYLDYKAGRPVLVMKRNTFVEGGKPIIYAKTVYRADRYEYKINLNRHAY
jgi:GntR family transcriptional regulator